MAEHGARAAEQRRGHPAGLTRKSSVANRVYAGVQAVEPTRIKAHFDRLLSHPDRQQLSPRHHPMLFLRELRNHLIESTRLL